MRILSSPAIACSAIASGTLTHHSQLGPKAWSCAAKQENHFYLLDSMVQEKVSQTSEQA